MIYIPNLPDVLFERMTDADGSLNPDVHLTIGGAVRFPGGYIHPEHFRVLMGEKDWEELLTRPRIVCEYDYEEEDDVE